MYIDPRNLSSDGIGARTRALFPTSDAEMDAEFLSAQEVVAVRVDPRECPRRSLPLVTTYPAIAVAIDFLEHQRSAILGRCRWRQWAFGENQRSQDCSQRRTSGQASHFEPPLQGKPKA
jgi:hypothetical protein